MAEFIIGDCRYLSGYAEQLADGLAETLRDYPGKVVFRERGRYVDAKNSSAVRSLLRFTPAGRGILEFEDMEGETPDPYVSRIRELLLGAGKGVQAATA